MKPAGRREEEPDEAVEVHGGAGGDGAQAGGGRDARGDHLPEAADHRSDVLPVEEQYGDLGVPELRELKQLRDENGRLKRLVADLSLDKAILQEALREKW